MPLPKGLTAHKLRHTFASVLIACGEDPISVMQPDRPHRPGVHPARLHPHDEPRPGERARLKALVSGERVAAVTCPQEPPRLLDCAAYELPILRALAERDGQARRREVRAAVLDAVEGRLTDLDRETLPSGEPRWEARFDKARSKLMAAGCLKSDSPRGVWELAAPGLKRLGATERRRLSVVAGQRSGAEREREAIAA